MLFSDLLKYHILPNVICSSVIEGKVRAINLLGRYVNLTRNAADNKLLVDSGEMVNKDVIYNNDVLHVINSVLVPDDGKWMDTGIPNANV